MISSVHKFLARVEKHLKAGNLNEAEKTYCEILAKFLKNKKGIQGYQRPKSGLPAKASSGREPPKEQVRELIELYKARKFEETLAKSEAMIKVFPKFAFILNISGAANLALQRYHTAIEAYRKALKLDPENAEFYGNIGNAFRRKGDLDAAVRCYRKALQIQPGSAALYYNIGNALLIKGEFESAIRNFKSLLRIGLNNSETWNNQGVALRGKGKLNAAIESYDKTIEISADHMDARYHRSLLVLNLEDFKTRWPTYEYRWKKSNLESSPTVTRRPKQRLDDQGRVLGWGEQGIGDQVIYASLIRDLYTVCSHLIMKADLRLIPILRRFFPRGIEFYANGETVPEYD